MTNDKKLRLYLALGVFAFCFVIYYATMAPTVSFWDCGELVGASSILGNPHPPGNPLFTTMARVFMMVTPLKEVASRVNIISVLTSALTVMMCFLFTIKVIGILFQGKLSRFSTYCSALIASFLVAFSDTFWFSAVEAEVYGTSMLIVMCISWLTLHWYENRGTGKAKRALIMICYLGFLGMGVHPFSFITIPAVALFLVFADKNIRTDIPMIVTGLALLSVIYDIGDFIWYALIMLAVTIVMQLLSPNDDWKSKWRFSMCLCLVALLGFSSYAYVPIRSKVNPTIDENEPRTMATFKEYLERKQYGSESMIRRAFHRRGKLQSQVLVHPHMGYGGYLLSQYFPWKVGETRGDENEPIVRHIGSTKLEFNTLWTDIGGKPRVQWILFVLFQAPFLYGGYLAYKRNPAVGGYLLLLYIVGSFALVFYMNFADGSGYELRDWEYWKQQAFNPQAKPDPVHLEVRDRDYFFTPGFMFMGILFGVAAAFLLEKLAKGRAAVAGGGSNGAVKGVGVALATLALVVPVFSNYKEHNRSGDYVPWDYAYNLLMSCRPNSVLFTNGDNDTFPLWFIQTVEHVRTDVRVVNLSLVNTNWYIKQLRSHEPKLNIGFTDDEIDQLEPQPWKFKNTVSMKLPNSAISVELEPRSYLKVQDIMVLHIVQNNYPKHPVHFAVTVSDDNMMGLEKYLVMEGMVYTIVEEKKNKEIDAQATAKMVDSIYKFRGLGDPKVYIDLNTEGLLTNYSATNFRLVMWAQEQISAIDKQLEDLRKQTTDSAKALVAAKEKERTDKIDFAEKYLKLNSRILPREWRNDYYGAQFYNAIKDFGKAETYYKQGMKEAPNPKLFGANLSQLYVEEGKYPQAESLLTSMKKDYPNDFELWYGLSDIYQKRGELGKAKDVLSEWLKGNPTHQYAAMVNQQVQFLEGQIRAKLNPPKPDSAKADATKAAATATAEAPPAKGGVPGLAPSVPKPAPKAAPAAAPKGKDTAAKEGSSAKGKS
jgi:tetratricopeptide (TPR) repeat protein